MNLDLIRPAIRQLTAYHVPDAHNSIKLDAMENPYTWDADLIPQWLEILQTAAINRYPDPAARQLKQQLRHAMAIPDNMQIILGNGSDELIQMLALTFHGTNPCLLAPEPSFAMYPLIAKMTGLQFIGIPLQSNDFQIDLPQTLAAIKTHQPALIFLACPNNPTGNLFKPEAIQAIITASRGVVVIDEAYAPFTTFTCLPYLQQYDNVLIMRTVSKLGLAGLRLGFLIGKAEWLQEIEKTRLPYNINILTQLTAQFALQHYPRFQAQTAQICADRTLLFQQLQSLPTVQAWTSEANFILIRVPDAESIFTGLKQKGILVKKLHGSHELLHNCLRITVGKPTENKAFLEALTALLPA